MRWDPPGDLAFSREPMTKQLWTPDERDPEELELYRIVARYVGSTLRILDHFLTARGFFRWRSRRFQHGLLNGLKDRVNQKTNNEPEKKSNQHSSYQVVRNGVREVTLELPAASSVIVWSSSGCLKSGAISIKGASTKSRP